VRRVVLVLAGAALAAALGWGGWCAWRRHTAPAPPDVLLREEDPELAAAVEAARQQVRRRPGSAAAWGDLGGLLRAADYREQAADCFAQAERLAPQDPRWPYLRGEALQQLDPDAALPHLERAVALYRDGDARGVVPRLRLAEVLLARGRSDDAEARLNQARALEPNNLSVLLDLALAAYARDDLEASRALLLRCQHSAFTRRRAAAQLALVSERLGDARAAADYSRRAAALPPDAHWVDPLLAESPGAHLGRPSRLRAVEQLEAQGRLAEAVQMLGEIVAESPDPQAYVGLGKDLAQLGRSREAEEALRTAVELAPDNVQAYYLLSKMKWMEAERRWQEGDRAGARDQFRTAADYARQALARKPDHALALLFLGLSQKYLDQRDEALESFRLAVECAPELPDPHLYYGEALAEAGRQAEARTQLEQAVHLARADDPRPREALARLKDKPAEGPK
jgi:tetratricopeptide (TPR) repeat protein